MPRRLFLKIFLWFLAVLITVITGTFLLGELMRPDRHGPPNRRPFEAMMAGRAQTAAEIYERDGQDGLVAQLDRTQLETGARVFLFSNELQELSGRRIPSSAPDVVRRVIQTRRPELFQSGPSPLHAEPVKSSAVKSTSSSPRCRRGRHRLGWFIRSIIYWRLHWWEQPFVSGSPPI
ncbi:MAG TPA: hypothetical protein VJU86_00020 [Pyrinomonadaceae bacterium]|nr:hypothetical protein [Pyrinomonadaceae bacterium]